MISFKSWLEQHGCTVTVTQVDDGSGYTVMDVETPERDLYDVTVQS